MPVEMAIWRMTETGPKQLEYTTLGLERELEDMIVEDPSVAGLDVLVIGRQVHSPHGGFIDVLALDSDGRVHVLELKRDRTPRDVVAQTLDYGTWTQDLTIEELERIFSEHHGEEKDLEDAFSERFGHALPDAVNVDQQLTIVASALDPASQRIVEYLADRFGVPINAVFFRHFADGDQKYLARTWLIEPTEVAHASRPSRGSKLRSWNGQDYYVILGNVTQPESRWDLARRYGLLSAGGGSWYWKPLRNLTPGHRVFAYVGGAGYVGVGIVEGTMMPARDALVTVQGKEAKLIDQPDLPSSFTARATSADPDDSEYVVPVRWLQARAIEDAVSDTGLFASQVTVCKLRDDRTIQLLEQRFDLAGSQP